MKKRTINATMAIACVIFGASLLAGCGGGGGGGGAPQAQNNNAAGTAEGLWLGTTSNSRSVSGIVLSDGSFYVLYTVSGNPSTLAGVILGNGTSQNGSFSSSNAKDFNLEGAGITNVTVSASYTAKSSLNGSVAYSNTTNTFTSAYNADYETTPTLAAIAGTYSGQAASSAGAQSANLTVASNGTFSGNTSGCSFTGTVMPRTDGNAYDTSVTFGPSPCLFANQTLTGLAYYRSDAKVLYAVAPNAGRTDGLVFVGSKP